MTAEPAPHPEPLLDKLRRLRELDRDDTPNHTAWENTEDEVAEWLFRTLGSLDQRDALRSVYLTNQPFHVLFDVITKLTTQFIKDDLPEIVEAFELLGEMEPHLAKDWRRRIRVLLSKVSDGPD